MAYRTRLAGARCAHGVQARASLGLLTRGYLCTLLLYVLLDRWRLRGKLGLQTHSVHVRHLSWRPCKESLGQAVIALYVIFLTDSEDISIVCS